MTDIARRYTAPNLVIFVSRSVDCLHVRVLRIAEEFDCLVSRERIFPDFPELSPEERVRVNSIVVAEWSVWPAPGDTRSPNRIFHELVARFSTRKSDE